MALIKIKELENGISGNYWKIIKVEVDFLQRTAEIWLGLLKDKTFNDERYDKPEYENSALLLKAERIQFGPENFPFTKEAIEGTNIKAVAYNAIKAYSEYFIDSQDDLAAANISNLKTK